MNEADFKRKIVADVKKHGGYARRIEDQFSVGFPDMVLRPVNSPAVFFVEAKIFIGGQFKPTERQLIELRRIHSPVSCGIVMGYNVREKVTYADLPREVLRVDDAVIKREEEDYSAFLVRLYHERNVPNV